MFTYNLSYWNLLQIYRLYWHLTIHPQEGTPTIAVLHYQHGHKITHHPNIFDNYSHLRTNSENMINMCMYIKFNCAWMICKWWMNGLAIENSCITNYVYWVLNKIINQLINQSIKHGCEHSDLSQSCELKFCEMPVW